MTNLSCYIKIAMFNVFIMYLSRFIEKVISKANKNFKVLYLAGPRQVGKTTLLRHLSEKLKINYVTFDNLRIRKFAKEDPELFLETYPAPLLIDEVQYVPELFSYIKIKVDNDDKNGRYWLTGSQQFAVLKNIKESLAGRVAILNLLGFSMAEEVGGNYSSNIFELDKLGLRNSNLNCSVKEIFGVIYRGFFPALVLNKKQDLGVFYNSYIQTYLDRDLRDFFGVKKVSEFQTFLQLCAARTGQLLNISELARDAGVSVPAAKEWIRILQGTLHIYLLNPYYKNISKRLIKAPKLYFLDTGLAAFLTKWQSAETLFNGAMAAPIFETFVVAEIIKSYFFRGRQPPLYYYRDKEGREIDLLIEKEGVLTPIEIKKAINITNDDVKHIKYFQKNIKESSSKGAVICLEKAARPFDRSIDIVPVGLIN